MLTPTLLHWWAAYPEITLPPTACPTSPDGAVQTAQAYVASADWLALFNTAFWVTALLALLAVMATYWTRAMGDQFAARWRWAIVLSTVAAGLVCYAIVTVPAVQTFGCQFGERTAHVPAAPALMRATVALVQAPIWFFLWSVALTRAVRVGRWQPWYNNSRFPV